MKNSIYLFLVLFLFFAISCKKKKEGPEQTMSSLADTQVPQKVDGYMEVYYYYKISNDSSKFQYCFARSMFYKEPKDKDSLYYFAFDADVGYMTINDSAMNKEIIGDVLRYDYAPTTLLQIEQMKNTRVWRISGTESFKNSLLTDNTLLPEYFLADLPDTIYESSDNTIKLGNYNGTAPIVVTIRSSGLGSGQTRPKTPSRSAKEIVFTESDLISFYDYTEPNVSIQLELINSSYQAIKGKVFCFTSHISYQTNEIPFKPRQ